MQTYSAVGERGSDLSQSLLQAACRCHWGMESLPPIEREQWGKPTFQLEGHQFNLSHSGGVVICCLATHPVGVDIQLPRPSRTAFLDKVCSQAEREWMLEREDSPQAFALLWAMKESLCKYTGRGITRPISNLIVPLPSALPTSGEWTVYPQGELVFSLCQLHGGMVAICAAQGMEGENRVCDLSKR